MKIYETPEGVDRYMEMSEGYDISRYSNAIDEHLQRGKSLLELGMGPGNDYKWLSEKYEVTGSDYSREFIERAKKRFPHGEFLILDAVTLPTDRKFDALFSCKVYQHIDLLRLKEVFRRQADILNRGGIIIHSFWVGGYEMDVEDMRFYYHDKDLLIKALSEYFTILYKDEYGEFEVGDSLFLIGEKK